MANNRPIVEKNYINEYHCTWVYKVDRDTNYEGGYRAESPNFTIGEIDKYKFNIELHFAGCNNSNNGYIGAKIYLYTHEDVEDFRATAKLCIVDKDGKEHFNQIAMVTRENRDTCHFPNFVKRDDLFSSRDLLPNDEVKFLCRISFDIETRQASDSEDMIALRYSSSHINNFEKMFDNPEYSDFEFIVGNTRLKVHKCILAAQSPVFAAMFQSDMLEKNEGVARIDDVDVNVVRQLLRFVYIGQVENIDDIADKLYIAADMYELDKLKKFCEEKLIEKLDIHNLYEIFKFVEKLDAAKLKDTAIGFIIHSSKKLSTMDKFKKSIEDLSAILLAEIICAFMDYYQFSD